MAGTSLYKNKSSINKQNLIDDLQKYGNLKLAIKNLEDNKKKENKIKDSRHNHNVKETKKKEPIINSQR